MAQDGSPVGSHGLGGQGVGAGGHGGGGGPIGPPGWDSGEQSGPVRGAIPWMMASSSS